MPKIDPYAAELDDYLDREAKNERQAEAEDQLSEQYAKDMTQAGREFYPWTLDHFEEAMSNASLSERLTVFIAVSSAIDLKLTNLYSNHLAMSAIEQVVERYWLDCAKADWGKSR